MSHHQSASLHRDLSWIRESNAATIAVSDASRLLGLDERTVLRGIEAGEIPSLRVGRRVLIPRARLLAQLDGAKTAPAPIAKADQPEQLADGDDAALGRHVRQVFQMLVAVARQLPAQVVDQRADHAPSQKTGRSA